MWQPVRGSFICTGFVLKMFQLAEYRMLGKGFGKALGNALPVRAGEPHLRRGFMVLDAAARNINPPLRLQSSTAQSRAQDDDRRQRWGDNRSGDAPDDQRPGFERWDSLDGSQPEHAEAARAFRSTREWQLRSQLRFIIKDTLLGAADLDNLHLNRQVHATMRAYTVDTKYEGAFDVDELEGDGDVWMELRPRLGSCHGMRLGGVGESGTVGGAQEPAAAAARRVREEAAAVALARRHLLQLRLQYELIRAMFPQTG